MSLALRKPDWSQTALHAIEVDLTDAGATAQAAASVAERFAVSTVVHNAGVDPAEPARRGEARTICTIWRSSISRAAILIVQAVLPGMRQRKFGRIVLMSSRAALGLQTRTAYAATKAGMIGMARTWALELGAAGITVNVVAPGPIGDTDNVSRGDPRRRPARGGDRQVDPGRPPRPRRKTSPAP